MDVGTVSGLLAEALARIAPGDLEAVFFTNSGAEGVEGALKFCQTGHRKEQGRLLRPGISRADLRCPFCERHRGIQGRNEPLLPGCIPVPFNDLDALDSALSGRDVAAFIVEPIQGKGVFIPDDDYLPGVRRLCDEYGALLIADEVQTGLGRTGRMFALNHWDVVPDLLIVSKALSGGIHPGRGCYH